MAQSIEESLFQAIKSDDRKSFDALMEKSQCGAYRLGRFPTLSLLYLYNSRKILAAYEEVFLKTTNSVTLSEPSEISKKFSAKAGKCLRLYMKEVVSPLEMLLILDKTERIKKIYPSLNVSTAVKERLKSIYYIKYSLSVKFEGGGIIFEKRPMTYAERKKLLTVCVSCVLIVLIAISGCVISSVFMPKRLDTYLDLTADTEYTLDKDVYLPRNSTIKEFNCTIIGNGHKLIFRNGASIETFNGKISDLVIETSGKPVISTVSSEAKIENITLNVNADIKTSKSTSLFVLTNNGIIDGVRANVSGKVTAKAVQTASDQAVVVAGIALDNVYSKYDRESDTFYDGLISNCQINFSDFTLVGELSANASFGGIVGNNNGCVQDSSVTGKITADTFDAAGICSTNRVLLARVTNKADISQVSGNSQWSPIACGIAITNNETIENCSNEGNISAVSNCVDVESLKRIPGVSAAGITYMNNAYVSGCINEGSITAQGSGEAYVGGISSHSYSQITKCISNGDILVSASKAYVGGILGYSQIYYTANWQGYSFAWGEVSDCVSACKMTVNTIEGGLSFVGGIIGYIAEVSLSLQQGEQYFGGGVAGSYFVGEYVSSATYFGNIVGGSGAGIYEQNVYTLNDDTQYYHYNDNYYVSNQFGAFGATVSGDEYNDSIEDKGATATTLGQIEGLESYQMIISIISNFSANG